MLRRIIMSFHPPFRDRTEAGRQLAERLMAYANRSDTLVLALPRGGVPVGYEVARALGAPLDVLVVRKLGVPGQEELAMGAIATGGVLVSYDEVVREAGISPTVFQMVAAREQRELERREQAYRDRRPPPDVRGRTIILVDDGLATGTTMRAAAMALQQQEPANIIVAVPVAARGSTRQLRGLVDEIVVLLQPEPFYGVGLWYADFTQTTDDEVRALLARAAAPQARPT
jgi:putative phosphoribosyl transferase